MEPATNSTTRQEDHVVIRRHDTDERAYYPSDRRSVPQRGDDQEPGSRLARRRGILFPSWRVVGQAALAWYTVALQEGRQVGGRVPQP